MISDGAEQQHTCGQERCPYWSSDEWFGNIHRSKAEAIFIAIHSDHFVFAVMVLASAESRRGG